MVSSYVICWDAEGFFECHLDNGTKIDVDFDALYYQIETDNPALFKVIDSYDTWDEGIEFLMWIEEPITPYLNKYLAQLEIDNGGSLEDLVWHQDEDGNWDVI